MSKAAKKQTKSLLKLKPFIDKLRKISLYKWFLTAFCIGSLLFAIITPPGQNPDEPNHMYRTWQLSSLNLRADNHTNKDGVQYGGQVSKSIAIIFTDAGFKGADGVGYKWKSISYSKESLQPINADDTMYKPFNNTAVYSPVAYLPGVVAIWLGSLLQLPAIAVFYLVRLAFLATAAALVYSAIRLTPRWKWIFATIALLPSTLSIASSVSADPVVIGATFVFIAYTLRLALQNKILSTKQLLILGALLSTVVLAKVSYCPVALLLLAIPLFNPNMRNKNSILKLGVILSIAALLAAVWMYLVRDIPVIPLRDFSINKSFLTHNPLAFIVILTNSLFYNGTIDLTGVIGHFGWLTSPMSDTFVFIGITAIILSVFVDNTNKNSLLRDKSITLRWVCLLLAIVVSTYVVISLSLYIYWAGYYSAVAPGLQARYIIPILPLILLTLSPLGTISEQKRLKIVLLILLLTTYIVGLFTAFAGYYISIPTSIV